MAKLNPLDRAVAKQQYFKLNKILKIEMNNK